MRGRLIIVGLACLGAFASMSCHREEECFSPEQNLDLAGQPGAVGCPCSSEDRGQCVSGVALVCSEGRWESVVDGPCFPGPGERCGEGFCSQYGYCDELAPDGPTCLSKRQPGETCSDTTECQTGECTEGICS
jgi:hypothetical protein